ncbi:PREDICTED: NADP-dependent oxidoreductase domain-containing protein 1 [Pygoscelis adeliae]|uniref:NADP-dependent oxidoreductase domain-containing protein 1 n=1 Tax=Pygoscelis adeliae TaxID=9238 RepID=UPI0004F4F828|nr:PREDICTED: NADP-dependent oxidoreductase domain-containing protein 1 [Pygoscelis adeliae]
MWDITEPFKSSQADEAVEGEEHVLSHAPSQQQPLLSLAYPPHADLSLSLVIVSVDVSARQSGTEKGLPTSLGDGHGLKVGIIGIIGGGYLGKQLAQALLTLSWAPCPSSCVSTRRPESLADLQKQGLACLYDNTQLVAWADVAFLCCLQSHVPSICFVIRPAIQKPSVVYSLVTTVPLLRLKQLLRHSAIVRPQYQCSGQEPVDGRGAKGTVQGKIEVNAEWLVAIFYAALNSSTWQCLPHQKALELLSDLCFPERCPICAGRKTCGPRFVCKNFVNKGFASSVTQEENFPWFDLTAAQLRECPFSQLLERNGTGQAHAFLIL